MRHRIARNAWQVVYVQKMYAANQGTHVLRLAVDGSEKNAADHA